MTRHHTVSIQPRRNPAPDIADPALRRDEPPPQPPTELLADIAAVAQLRFEVDGADYAAEFLTVAAVPARVDDACPETANGSGASAAAAKAASSCARRSRCSSAWAPRGSRTEPSVS